MEITDIKAHLSIQTVLSHYGLKPNKHDMLNCPFHGDKNASLKIYSQTNTFNCFGCGKNGDTIELIQEKEKYSKHEALIKAASLVSTNNTNNKNQTNTNLQTPKTQTMQGTEERTRILTKIFESFKNGLNHPMSLKPKEYLKSRGLSPSGETGKGLEIGYNSGQFHHRGSLNETDMQACINAGLLIPYTGKTPNANGTTYTPFAKDCIIFPLKNKQNQIVSIYGRSIIDNNNAKHYYLKDRCGLYPCWPKANTQKLILTEAIIDAATLLQIPEIKAEYEILSLYGTNGLSNEHLEAIREWTSPSGEMSEGQRGKEIIFFFDGDKAGTEAIKKYQEEFTKELPGIKLSSVETPENEDINSLLQGHEPEILSHLIENRKPFFLLPEGIEAKENQCKSVESVKTCPPTGGSVSNSSKLNTRNPDFITFTTEDPPGGGHSLQIIILGGINLQQLDRLRITLKISRLDTGDPLHSIRHTLDLYHSDYLEKFINKASEQLETGTNTLKRAIAELTEQIEAYRLSKIESQKDLKPKDRQLTEQRQKRAIAYLKASKLMERTNQDIGKTGMVGEENNRLLMYLVFTSRLRDQPLHIISLGSSGTGKTYLQEKISELIPENDKLEITILSENAFYYFDRKELKQKLVLIEDMDGAQEVLYPLRELQTKRKISKTIPIKDSKGNLKTITLHVEGPICLAGTTTRERLYEDNSNRSLLIYLDNSHDHKEKIMEYQRKLSAGKIDDRKEQELKEFFKDMQSVLKPVKVRNPFAELLKLPEYVFKPLRTNSHYLATIETITFYHQYQREIKKDAISGESYIETTLEDIEWANQLLKDVILAKADELPRAVREFFERLKNWLQTNKSEVFYTKEIRETFRITSSSCNRYILELLRNNYIKITGGNKFRQGFEYQIVKQDEYQKLKEHVKNALDEALENIRKSVSRIPTVSQNRNGILKQNNISVLNPVSQ
jgi:DNA primase catalytic core